MLTCEQQWNGLLASRTADMRDPKAACCPTCKGKGSLNAFARTGRTRNVMCNACLGTGNAPKKEN
ncbi:MAG TPA: hypothetical protein VM120_07480 [Bryobacteraceae bacterium]|nr:hypothetical protein [Bryobacteraceae bacterium]